MIWNSQMRTEKDLSDSFFRQNVTTIHKYAKFKISSRKKYSLFYSPKINRKENLEPLPNAECRLGNVG